MLSGFPQEDSAWGFIGEGAAFAGANFHGVSVDAIRGSN